MVMLKYDKFCNQVLEKVTNVKWLKKTFSHCMSGNLPLTPKIAKALYDTKKTVFHITDPLRILDLKKLVKSKKSISSFSEMHKNKLSDMAGVQTSGGILLQIEGNLVLSAESDIMSMPDEQGRRWISDEWLYNADDFFEPLHEIIADISDEYNLKGAGWYEDKQLKRTFISEYIKRTEEFVIKNIDKLKQLISKQRGGSWDEILVNEIKIKDVLLLDLNQSYLTNDIIKAYGSLENCYDILKSIVDGEIYITNDRSDAIKFVQDRGGVVR